MKEYNKANLHNISKFAQAHRHGIVSDQFNNVFMNIDEAKTLNSMNHSMRGGKQLKSFLYAIKENGKIAHTKEGSYRTREDDPFSMKDYYVYDHICTDPTSLHITSYEEPQAADKLFNVARVENKADNPYIRFRIFGGPDKGLQISFSRFKDDEHISNFQVMTYFSMERYRSAGLSWSSPMYKINNRCA